MDPLSPDQVEALERAADDVDRFHGCEALTRRRRDVADWSLWEAVVIQGVPLRRAASILHLKRGLVRMALGRVRQQLERDPTKALADPALQLYPPQSWEGTDSGSTGSSVAS